MVTVTVRSYTPLPDSPPDFKLGRPFELVIERGTTVAQLTKDVLTVPQGWVSLVAVNGQRSNEDHVLEEQDRVDLFPPIGGG